MSESHEPIQRQSTIGVGMLGSKCVAASTRFRWTQRMSRLTLVVASMLALASCAPSGPNERTLAVCEAVPAALEEMQALRERLTGDQFRNNVQPVVMEAYEIYYPVFQLADRAASEDREGEYWTIGGRVRGGWFAYVNMDTWDQRQGYEDFSEAIQGLYSANRQCQEIEL